MTDVIKKIDVALGNSQNRISTKLCRIHRMNFQLRVEQL